MEGENQGLRAEGLGLRLRRIAPVTLLAMAGLLPMSAALAIETHVVLPGETLSGIADRFGVPVSVLVRANALSNPDLIFAGQTLKLGDDGAIPASHTSADVSQYTVQPGDSLSSIGKKFGLSAGVLASVNGLADPNHIEAGQVLSISGASQPEPVAPAVELSRHMIQPGESLSIIARTYNTTVAALIAANQLDNENLIVAGQTLLVPRAVVHISLEEAEAVLRSAESEFGLPRGLLLALAWQESGWQQGIESDAGAIGITQLLPETADWAIEQFAPDAHDWQGSARDNARLGAAVLAYYLHRTDGDVRLSLAAYYQGWKSVETWGLFDETEAYVANVRALAQQFQ